MKTEKKLTGDPQFWIFILLDACIFYAIYVYLAYHRWADPEVFFLGQSSLSPVTGAVNTSVLLLSSFFVAQAINEFRENKAEKGRKYVLIAIALGVLFTGIKLSEYLEIIRAAHVDLQSTFFIHYFSFTGLHLFHLIVGLLVLWWCGIKAQASLETIETAAVYWHFVDIAWVFLFLQLYLAK